MPDLSPTPHRRPLATGLLTSDHGAISVVSLAEGLGCSGPARAGRRQPETTTFGKLSLYRPDCPFAIAIAKPGTSCSPSGPSSVRTYTPIGTRVRNCRLRWTLDIVHCVAGQLDAVPSLVSAYRLSKKALPHCPVPSAHQLANPGPASASTPPVRWPPLPPNPLFSISTISPPNHTPVDTRPPPLVALLARRHPARHPDSHRPSPVAIAIAITIAVAASPTLNHHPATPDPLPRHPPLPSLTRDDSIAST